MLSASDARFGNALFGAVTFQNAQFRIKPYDKIQQQVALLMKKIVDQKIFPWSKFLMSAQEVENGYVQMAMMELGWKENKPNHVVKRARSWQSLVD